MMDYLLILLISVQGIMIVHLRRRLDIYRRLVELVCSKRLGMVAGDKALESGNVFYYLRPHGYDLLRRSWSNIYLKMSLFMAEYDGAVNDPIAPFDINYYCRQEVSDGTKFCWFEDMETAEAFAANANNNVISGPHRLPLWKFEGYQ